MSDSARDAKKTIVRLFAVLVLFVAVVLVADWTLRAEHFPVRNMRFEGEFNHVTVQQLQDAVLDVARGNFFLVDLEIVRRRIEALPWVYRVSVRRQWPRDIYIGYTEQRLVAQWDDVEEQEGDSTEKSIWVNESGETVALGADAASPDLPWFEGPKDTAPQVLAQFRHLDQILAGSGLRLRRLVLTPRRSWRMEMDSAGHSISVELDRDKPEKKISRFARAYSEHLVHQIGAIKRVDLRYTNGFSVEWNNEAGAAKAHAFEQDATSYKAALPAKAVHRAVRPAGNETIQAGYEG
jgi:cell division protein FtsQ